jgi:hypothetical protein
MSRITIEIPTELHRAVKSYTASHGGSIKDFFVEAVTERLRKEVKMRPDKLAKPVKSIKKSSKSSKRKNSKYITEEEADRMLKPLLLRMVKQIHDGTLETYTEEEFFAKLKEGK